MTESEDQALYVVTSTPGPTVQFVELENTDGAGAETQVPYERYKDGLWRLGPLYPLAYVARLSAQLAARDGLLNRLLQWDHFDGAGDGPYWRREINAVLDVWLPVGTRREEASDLAGQSTKKGEAWTGPGPTLRLDAADTPSQEAGQ